MRAGMLPSARMHAIATPDATVLVAGTRGCTRRADSHSWTLRGKGRQRLLCALSY